MERFKDVTPLRLYAAALECANIEKSLKAYLILIFHLCSRRDEGKEKNIMTPFAQPSLPFLLSSSVKQLSLFVSLQFRSSRYLVPLSTSNISLPPPPDLV